MKVKARIPKGVIALVCTIPALNRNEELQDLYNVLIEIIQFKDTVASNGQFAKEYFDKSTKQFDVDAIFKKWSELNPDDPSRKMVRGVCAIIKEEMFE